MFLLPQSPVACRPCIFNTDITLLTLGVLEDLGFIVNYNSTYINNTLIIDNNNITVSDDKSSIRRQV